MCSNCSETTPSSHARRPDFAEKLWKITEELIEQAGKETDKKDAPPPAEEIGEQKNDLKSDSDPAENTPDVVEEEKPKQIVSEQTPEEDPKAQGDASCEEVNKD